MGLIRGAVPQGVAADVEGVRKFAVQQTLKGICESKDNATELCE
jgi:hypothetical protein